MAKQAMYSTLPPWFDRTNCKKLGLKKVHPEEFVSEFLKRYVPEDKDVKKYIPFTSQQDKKVKAEQQASGRKPKSGRRKKKKACLSSSERKRLKVFDVDKKKIKFEHFRVLHEMWKEYISNHLDSNRSVDPATLNQHLLRADLHGCWLVVCASSCPSYVGTSGIVVQETRNVFKLVTKDSKMKVVPKLNSIFAFKLGDRVYKIHGTNFRCQPFGRSKAKFKTKQDDGI